MFSTEAPEDVEQLHCSACGGPVEFLGQLGRREHFRCQDCGQEASRKIVAANGNVVWSPEAGWHDGPEAHVSVADGRIVSEPLYVVRVRTTGAVLTKPLPHITAEHFVKSEYPHSDRLEIVPATDSQGGLK
jgi:hypothetical protein